MVEKPLEYLDDVKKGIRYIVPKEAVTIDGKLEFKDEENDGNIVITIEEENNG